MKDIKALEHAMRDLNPVAKSKMLTATVMVTNLIVNHPTMMEACVKYMLIPFKTFLPLHNCLPRSLYHAKILIQWC